MFDHPLQQEAAAKHLISFRQCKKSAVDHSVDFRITAEEAGWDKLALCGIYVNFLSDQLKDQLTTRDDPGSLDELISLSIKIDNRLKERRRKKNYISHNPPLSTCQASELVRKSHAQHQDPEPEPMQVGRTRLTPEERQRRFKEKVCIYCGQGGHFVANCPVRGNGTARQ